MTEPNAQEKLQGTVEIDETYVGGKPRYTQKRIVGGPKLKTGRGTKKTPVMVMIQRDGNARARVISDVTGKTLKNAILENVDKTSRIITDELPVYKGIGKPFKGGHEAVKHNNREYVRGDVYTNTAESFFALLKRGIYGTFHSVSKKHLHRYASEFSYRWNTRKMNDGERLHKLIRQSDGKRLMYREPTAKIA